MEKLAHPSEHRTWVEIDPGAVRHNLMAFRRHLGPDVRIMPCIKSDAYGHGALEIAPVLLAAGADRLAVATAWEGEVLRQAGIGVPIQVLGALFPEEVELAVRNHLIISAHDLYIPRLASLAASELEVTVQVHLKVDTGMGRLGVLPAMAVTLAREISNLPSLNLEGLFMHYAVADDPDYRRRQTELFRTVGREMESAGLEGLLYHAASSSAIVSDPDTWFDLVRPGAGIYGYLSPASLRQDFPLRPAMAWRTSVIHLKDYPTASSLGYNRTYHTSVPTRVAVLPLGYADGYRREYSNRARVLVKGKLAPVVGMVSMDYTMVDVTGIREVGVGTQVTLMGNDGENNISAEELAEWGGSIPYCVTTGLGPRVTRTFLEDRDE
jgi:alanine racemase